VVQVQQLLKVLMPKIKSLVEDAVMASFVESDKVPNHFQAASVRSHFRYDTDEEKTAVITQSPTVVYELFTFNSHHCTYQQTSTTEKQQLEQESLQVLPQWSFLSVH